MPYDFTTVLDRRGMDSIAADIVPWDVSVDEGFDAIPMWVADMAYPVAPPVLDAMRKRLEFPSLGYYPMSDEYFDSILSWQRRRHGALGLEREHIGYENGVLGGVAAAVQAFTAPGEKILVHSAAWPRPSRPLPRRGRRSWSTARLTSALRTRWEISGACSSTPLFGGTRTGSGAWTMPTWRRKSPQSISIL